MANGDAKLRVDDGGIKEFTLGDEPFLIGRSQECQVHLNGNPNASRKHAEIRRMSGRYVLTDLGSGNGTLINGQKVMEAPLGDGDTISIGGVEMKFIHPSTPKSAAAPPARPPAPAPAGRAPAPPPPQRTAPPPPPGRAAAPRQEEGGTEAVDMGKVFQKMSEETATLDSPPSFREDGESGVAPAAKNKTPLFIAGGILLLVGVLAFAFKGKPKGPTGPAFEPFTKVDTEVGEFAYVTLEHKELRVKDPSIFTASSKSDGRNEIMIKGLKAGTAVLQAVIDDTHGVEIEVRVSEKEAWPKGWTQDDRLAAAEELKKQADGMYRTSLGHVDSMIPVYYLYIKVVRLYDNCEFHPEEPYQQATERWHELEATISGRETDLLREFRRCYSMKEYEQSDSLLNEILALFPEDGQGTDLLTKHGDSKKYHQYFLLRETLRQKRGMTGGS